MLVHHTNINIIPFSSTLQAHPRAREEAFRQIHHLPLPATCPPQTQAKLCYRQQAAATSFPNPHCRPREDPRRDGMAFRDHRKEDKGCPGRWKAHPSVCPRFSVLSALLTTSFLDPKDQNLLEYKLDTFSSVYRNLAGKDVHFE